MRSDGKLWGMSESPITADAPAPHWSSIRESGTVLGIRLLYRLYRLFGRRVFHGILWLVGVWYACTRPLQRRASMDFLRTHARCYPERWPSLEPGTEPGWSHTIRHFQSFGEAVLDKGLAWTATPGESDFTLIDEALVRQTLADPRGQLVIGSHFGNLEYCRGFLQATHARTVNVLVHDRHSANFVAAMSHYSPDSRLNVFQVDELDVGRILELKSRIDAGEWLFIAGDRIPLSGERRTAVVRFMGRDARAPIGPYLLARALACPVKLMFAWREGQQVFVDLQEFSEKVELPRKGRDEALTRYAAQFALALEAAAARAPFQWFNFYPFWGTATLD